VIEREFAVEVKELTVKFGDFTAVDDITFSVRTGEIFGFLGANGAGKTTTIRVLCGLLVPQHGHVLVAGHDFSDGGWRIKHEVGYMSQRFTLYNDLTVAENLAFTASLRKMTPEKTAARMKELFEFIEFTMPMTTRVADLPGGLKQELSLAAAMLHEPDVVFLDEPTAGVSPASRRRFWALIRRVAKKGVTVFVTTHYMDEAEECDRIALMRAGKIIALDSPKGLKTSAFPEKLVEIEAPEEHIVEWRKKLAASGAVHDIQPHGMRFHAVVRDQPAFEKAVGGQKWHEIRPSLEDVFVRLVEGDDR
jgi:ABC-2 type transport system ATP-binding protein